VSHTIGQSTKNGICHAYHPQKYFFFVIYKISHKFSYHQQYHKGKALIFCEILYYYQISQNISFNRFVFSVLNKCTLCYPNASVAKSQYLLCNGSSELRSVLLRGGANSGAVGWGTALQIRRSWVRLLMVLLEFFIDIILPAELWSWGWLNL